MLKPSAPTPDNLRTLKLSLFDQLDRYAYVAVLFNYLPNSTSSYNHDELEKSLAETLTNKAAADNNNNNIESSLLHLLPIIDHQPSSPSSPLLGVQVNLPSFDPNTLTSTCTPNVIKRFVFDALAIENLKKTIKDDSTMMRQPTRLVVVMSLLWKVLAHISSDKNKGNSRNSSFGSVMCLRGRIPSLERVVGTFSIPEIANMEGGEYELNDFVKLIGNRIGETCAAIGKASKLVDDISSLTINNQIKIIEKILQRDNIDIYGTTSWCKYPWDEADFGWGKPFCVNPVSVGIHELIILMDTKYGDGIEIIVTMKENDMT
ncbi:hypothetical protein EJD97_016631 [Solanum chilense]|uniref:Uncharacterized protein n=1 Tax=Solanum chilense TaxID=4083 RepID=A0A6N2B9A5_SOLCI|nr:hypothetical protein EJD97_016631 [Solanum chilense]